MSTLGMQLELTMTGKGVQSTLKDAQGEVLRTASIVKTQLGGGAEQAGQGIFKLKEGLGRARETAMYFTAAVGEFGPAGRTAQMALSSLGSMMLGGGLLGAGLAAAQAAVRLLTSAWEEEAAASKKAADEAKRAGDEIRKATAAAVDATAALNLKAAGGTGAMEFMRSGIMPVRAQLAAAKAAEAAAQADLEAWTQNIQSGDFAMRTVAPTIEAARQAVATTSVQVAALQGQLSALTDQAQALVGGEEKGGSADAKKERDARAAAEYKRLDDAGKAALRKMEEQKKEEERIYEERAKNGQRWLDARARASEAALEAELKAQQQFVAAMAPVTNAIQEAFAGMVQGTMSVGQALRKVLAGALQAFVQVALKQITANAAVAGSGAAASQASTPVIGPALSAAAMAAVMGMVLGLTSMISASGGADIGNYAPMAQLHPREMVLPADIADPLRQSLSSGGLGGGIHLTVHAMDARSVRRLLLDNGPALAEAIGKAARDGRSFS